MDINNFTENFKNLKEKAAKGRNVVEDEGAKWYENILKIKFTSPEEYFHRVKRISSFMWFDIMLDYCQICCCPSKIITPPILYALSDISLEGYLLGKTDEFYEERIGTNNDERYRIAKKRIDVILNCQRREELRKEIFDIDTDEILELGDGNETTFRGARKRKAYWVFLKNYHSWSADEDYYEAEKFIQKIHSTYNKNECDQEDIADIKAILQENHHIANPLDLYRFCIVRAKAR